MEFQVTIYRKDEEESEGKTFDSIKEAHKHIKSRSKKEKKSVTDYQIKVIHNE